MANKKKFTWNAEQSKRVESLSGLGLRTDQIASIEGMSRATIQRVYQKEITEGREKAVATVAKTAYQMAVGGKVPAMTMFWLKTQAQWREVQRVEHSGPDGKAIETKENITFDTQWRSLPSKNEKGDA